MSTQCTRVDLIDTIGSLGIGDPHYAQDDGEVCVTAIETDAIFVVRTAIVKDGMLSRGPHYERPSTLLKGIGASFFGFPATRPAARIGAAGLSLRHGLFGC